MSGVIVTGAAGFIGYHVSSALLERGETVVGVDSLNTYYDVSLKRARLERLLRFSNFHFEEISIADRPALDRVFASYTPDRVINLAAQPGVRYSLENPQAYVESNLTGFVNILEACRHNGIRHLVYASSSSVYGKNTCVPFSPHDPTDHPISLYGATKKANEMMAHTYSHLFDLPTTGLRFFTVYGPWGRPDMAVFQFTRAILEGRAIDVYNHGRMRRDFTYVDDIARGVVLALDCPPSADPAWRSDRPDAASSDVPYRLFNIGNHQPVELLHLISTLERCLGKTAEKRFLPLQPGDVLATFADVDDLQCATGFVPTTSIEVGLARFTDWYRSYYAA